MGVSMGPSTLGDTTLVFPADDAQSFGRATETSARLPLVARRSDPNSSTAAGSPPFLSNRLRAERCAPQPQLVPACAPVIAPGGSPVIAPIAPTRLPAIILRILGGNAIELFRIYIGAFQTFRTTSTLPRRSFRLGSPGDHKASCRREPAHQAEQECTSFHQLFSIAPPLRQCISFVSGVEAHAWFWPR
jgi:hypothetical protein